MTPQPATLPEAARTEPVFDLNNIESLSAEVLSSMQALRDLFEARAGKLEACQTALQQRCEKFAQEQQTFASSRTEHTQSFEKLEAELAQREQRCAQREEQLT